MNTCPHCNHRHPGHHRDPVCPVCGRPASTAKVRPPKGDFPARISETADLDAIPDERIVWERGERINVEAHVLLLARNSPEKQMVPLRVALAVLEPIDHHLAPVAELAAGEGEERERIGDWVSGKHHYTEMAGKNAEIKDLVAKVRALEAERGGRPAGDDIKFAVGQLREFMDTPRDTLITEKNEWVNAAWTLIHHAENP